MMRYSILETKYLKESRRVALSTSKEVLGGGFSQRHPDFKLQIVGQIDENPYIPSYLNNQSIWAYGTCPTYQETPHQSS